MDRHRMQEAEMAALLAHQNQKYDIFPYEKHLRDVVDVIEHFFGRDEPLIISAWLHDSIEDTYLTYNKIKQTFGIEVAEIVFAVTDELGRNRQERHDKTYPKIVACGWKAVAIKLADRIANVEHSIRNNHDLFDMYRREYEEFAKALYFDCVELKPMWDYIHCLMQDVAIIP
jgi:(p)ppGpp synthase/HD superfamily hydrolase